MSSSLIARIAAKYGLETVEIRDPQKGYRNQSFPVILKNGVMVNVLLYKSEPGILQRMHDTHRVSNFLATQHFAVRHTISPKIIQLTAGTRIKYGALYNYLPGTTIAWESYTRRHIKLLGATMSDMHAALVGQQLTSVNVIEEYLKIVTRMQHYFSKAQVQEAMRDKLGLAFNISPLERSKKLLTSCKRYPSQTLHMDFVRGNILFEGSGETLIISGILDFEKTAYGPKYFDIARTVAFLLVDCKYITEEKVLRYFLYSGYEKRGGSSLRLAGESSNPRKLIREIVNLFLAYDFYKFLRHNPYEALQENEHYHRTVALMLKQQRSFIEKTQAHALQ